MRASALSVYVAGTLLAGCAAVPVVTGPSPTLAQVPVIDLPDGHKAVLVRSHEDEWKVDGRDVRVTVQYLWDYTARSARVRTLAADDGVLTDEPRPGLTLNATDEEMAWAYELARSVPAIAAKVTADTDYYGGFSYRHPGDPGCDLGSRCVHVIASRDGGRFKVFHAIVDLQAAQVVHPDYDPAMGGLDEPRTVSE
jgi:hypothetical protein